MQKYMKLKYEPASEPLHISVKYLRVADQGPQKALRGGIPGAVLEPLGRSWSHFVAIYRQKLTKSSKNDF